MKSITKRISVSFLFIQLTRFFAFYLCMHKKGGCACFFYTYSHLRVSLSFLSAQYAVSVCAKTHLYSKHTQRKHCTFQTIYVRIYKCECGVCRECCFVFFHSCPPPSLLHLTPLFFCSHFRRLCLYSRVSIKMLGLVALRCCYSVYTLYGPIYAIFSQ